MKVIGSSNSRRIVIGVSLVLTVAICGAVPAKPVQQTSLTLGDDPGAPSLDGFFYETAAGRTQLPPEVTSDLKMPDGRTVNISRKRGTGKIILSLSAEPSNDIVRWGFSIAAAPYEYFTGLMERVVDGRQQDSWAPGIKAAMDLRGKKVDMLVKPTTSVYAPFYLSSSGYAVFVKGTWPGVFDFAAAKQDRVSIAFEGPSMETVIYMAPGNPAALVKAHAMEAGPPVLPPKWNYGPWRWRDEHKQRTTYYDGTPVAGPFNSEVMEDVLMMKAFGIPNSVYWIDRPWGPGIVGYDDFEIDANRLPNFREMVRWLDAGGAKTVLWIAPFVNGKMAAEAEAKKLTLPGQTRPAAGYGQNYPNVDLTNPEGRAFWQSGVQKLLDLGVAGFKLDRAEEDMPETGPYKVHDGRSIRENRNAYPAMFVQTAYEVAKKARRDDFVVMPRAAYTGSAEYGVFWGGDIGGTQEGLRASIIAVQRSAVLGYPNWGSDTCGYNEQLMEQEVCGRWLEFSAFTPIMEVGPTQNLAFWNLRRAPQYDETLIALWRMYARIHQSLADYSYKQAEEAHKTGMPIVRPMFLVDPKRPESWSNWWTYMYGPDIVVSPVWEKTVRTQQVFLPSGSRWVDAWNPKSVHEGGKTVGVEAEPHQIPIFVREGSKVKLGDLNKEWQESQAIAKKRPDLKVLEAEVSAWFQKAKKK